MMVLPVHEMEFTYVRSSGPGGQNVNKVNSKCVLRWNPFLSSFLSDPVKARFQERHASRLTNDGEIVISSDKFRDQKRNYEDCLEKIRQMVTEVLRPPKTRRKTKPTRSSQKRRLNEKSSHSKKKRDRSSNWD